MKLTYKPYILELKHSFNLANYSRTTTPVVLTEIEYEGMTGFGEASMPQYLGETQESCIKFLSRVDLSSFEKNFKIDEIMQYVDSIEPGNTAAKASIDIALHDLYGKINNVPIFNLYGFSSLNLPETSFTIGIDTPEIISEKLKEANRYRLLKIKLGSSNDKNIIDTIRSKTDKPIIVDINQGWKDKYYALDFTEWLAEKNVQLIEQPFPVSFIDETAWLNERSPLPIFADEACQRIDDIKNLIGVYSGINIKLMKCSGIYEAQKMIKLAEKENLKIMLGCMTETSCAVSAAAQLAGGADWADLDGNLLIKNDPFSGVEVINGKLFLKNSPGIGITKSETK